MSALWTLACTAAALGDSHRVYARFAPVPGLVLSILVLGVILSRLESLTPVTSGAIAEAFATAFSEITGF